MILALSLAVPLGSAEANDKRTVDKLAIEVNQQYEKTVAAVEVARMPLVPAVVGGGFGFGIGAIGAAAYAYQNRGMS